MLHRLQLSGYFLNGGKQIFIDKEEPVPAVVDDMGEVFGKKAHIDGMQNRAAAGYGEIKLQVAVGVPGQGTDRVPPFYAQGPQNVGQPADPFVKMAVGVPEIPFQAPRKNLIPGK